MGETVNNYQSGARSVDAKQPSRPEENSLLNDADHFRWIVENSIDVVSYVNAAGVLEYASPSVRHILGYEPEELIGQLTNHLVHPDDMDKTMQVGERVLNGKQTQSLVRRMRHKDGRYVWLETAIRPVFDASGTVTHALGVARDITERIKSEEAIRESEALIRQYEKLSTVGQLAAGIAHEIRNPLTALLGFTRLLDESAVDQQKQYLAIMSSELTRIQSIIDELLRVAKPQSTQFQWCDAARLVQEVTTLLSMQAILRNVRIELEGVDVPLQIFGDPNQIKQVFVNVMKNAIEAMPSGGELRIQAAVLADKIQLSFIDEGSGIPADDIAKVGESFYTTKADGTGLGVLVCRRIMQAHDGGLEISSRDGEGTCVALTFPVGSLERKPAYRE